MSCDIHKGCKAEVKALAARVKELEAAAKKPEAQVDAAEKPATKKSGDKR